MTEKEISDLMVCRLEGHAIITLPSSMRTPEGHRVFCLDCKENDTYYMNQVIISRNKLKNSNKRMI